MDSRSERQVYPAPSRTRRSPSGLPLEAALTGYARALYAENKSRETIERV
jgi:hypothetical protein